MTKKRFSMVCLTMIVVGTSTGELSGTPDASTFFDIDIEAAPPPTRGYDAAANRFSSKPLGGDEGEPTLLDEVQGAGPRHEG